MNTHLIYSVLLTLLLTPIVTAQNSGDKSDPIDLTVLNHSWRKESSSQQVSSNPRRPPDEDRIGQTPAERDILLQRGKEWPNQSVPVPPSRSTTGGGRDVYVYKITVKNDGAKLIKEVDWEFRFLHPDTQEELGNVRVSSKVNLSPGKTKVIKSRTHQQPIGVVLADQLDNKYRDQFREEVVIHRIVYSDGSAWQRQP